MLTQSLTCPTLAVPEACLLLITIVRLRRFDIDKKSSIAHFNAIPRLPKLNSPRVRRSLLFSICQMTHIPLSGNDIFEHDVIARRA